MSPNFILLFKRQFKGNTKDRLDPWLHYTYKKKKEREREREVK